MCFSSFLSDTFYAEILLHRKASFFDIPIVLESLVGSNPLFDSIIIKKLRLQVSAEILYNISR